MPIKQNVLITGSIAIDNVTTPFGEANGVLGGSATYASFAASIFSNVKILGLVGSDFPEKYIKKFIDRKIDISGLKISSGQTFRWEGLYEGDMNEVKTLSVCANNLKDTSFKIPAHYKDIDYLFLANTDPEIQSEIIEKVNVSKRVLLDTMNIWVTNKADELRKLLKKIDIMLLNEHEARIFTGKDNLITAGKERNKMGPEAVVIKKGENGALLFQNGNLFSVPAYPLEVVKDPTGAGDTFAGAFVGYLASCENINNKVLRKATLMGTVVASFTVEDFSTENIESITLPEVEGRLTKIKKMLQY